MPRLTCLLLILFCKFCLANPEQLINSTFKNISHELSLLKEDSVAQTERIIKNNIEPHLDMERISKLVLADQWKRASLNQKNRFMQCFTRKLRNTHAKSLMLWTSGKWHIDSSTFNESGSKAAVTVALKVPLDALKLVLRLYKSQQHWYIYDAAFNSISLLKNYRDDFALKIENQGLAKTLAKLCQQYPLKTKKLFLAANEWPPFIGRSLPGQGFSVELVRQVFKAAGYEVDMTLAPWRKVMKGMQQGKYDISVAAWSNENRKKEMLFSEPYFHNQLVVLSSRKEIQSVESFQHALIQQKQRLGLMEDYAYGSLIPDNARIVYHQHYTPLLRKLASKELDLALLDASVAQHYLHSLPQLSSRLRVSTSALDTRSLHITMLKEHPVAKQVMADFNRSLKRYLKSKPHRQLLARFNLKTKHK